MKRFIFFVNDYELELLKIWTLASLNIDKSKNYFYSRCLSRFIHYLLNWLRLYSIYTIASSPRIRILMSYRPCAEHKSGLFSSSARNDYPQIGNNSIF